MNVKVVGGVEDEFAPAPSTDGVHELGRSELLQTTASIALGVIDDAVVGSIGSCPCMAVGKGAIAVFTTDATPVCHKEHGRKWKFVRRVSLY